MITKIGISEVHEHLNPLFTDEYRKTMVTVHSII